MPCVFHPKFFLLPICSPPINFYFCTINDERMVYEGNSRPWEYEDADTLTTTEEPYSLIVWNDEVNTFEWVIETLIQVCGHSNEQAEQCAYLIHYKGKYAVKNGSYDDLKQYCDAITERGIGATIEVTA